MNPTLEDAVSNFDLDFLHPTTNNIPVQALRHRYINSVKKRIIRVQAISNHCQSLRLDLLNKDKELELLNKKLESANQEHTQTSLDYKLLLENYSKCENECQSVKLSCKNYHEKYLEAENQAKAGKSHVEQLQQLVTQYEREKDNLEKKDKKKSDKVIRDRLEKELLQWKKRHKKVIAEWQIKYDTLAKKLSDSKSVTDKGKVNLQYSSEHKKKSDEFISDSLSLDGHSENEDYISVDCSLPCDPFQSNLEMTQSSIRNKPTLTLEVDSNNRMEVVSVDTGCGSSLASSENEKWLNSPDYIFSPIHGESADKIRQRKLVDIATSTILITTAETATSPIIVEMKIDVSTSPITIQDEICEVTEPLLESDINNVTSNPPGIQKFTDVTDIVLTGSKKNIIQPKTSSAQILEKSHHQVIPENFLEPIAETNNQSKETVPSHSSSLNFIERQNTVEDYNTDREIEMILGTMRLHHNLISPIPGTPKKVRDKAIASCGNNAHTDDLTHCACPDAAIAKDLSLAAREEAAQARRDIARTNEDQKTLIENFSKIMKEMLCVKTFLKNRFSAAGTALDQLDDTTVLTDLLENISSVNLNDNCHNLLKSTALRNTVTQIDLFRSPSPLASVAESDIEQTPPNSLENLDNKQHVNEVSSNSVLEGCAKPNEKPSATENIVCSETGVDELEIKLSTKETKKGKYKKVKKISKLNKYRSKCELRKYKIKRETPPLSRKFMKPKQVRKLGIKKAKSNDTAATLNDKQVYAKAVKVMAELNAVTTKHSTDTIVNSHIQHKKCNLNRRELKVSTGVASSMLTSEKTDFLSSTTNINSPQWEISSPSPKINSPTSEINSSTQTINSSTPEINSSTLQMNSPTRIVNSPTPDTTLSSPNITTTSLRRLTRSLRLSSALSSSETTHPELVIATSKRSQLSPKSPSTSLKLPVKSPKAPVTSFKAPVTPSKELTTSPKAPVMSPITTIKCPEQPICPKPAVTSTKPAAMSSKSPVTSPKTPLNSSTAALSSSSLMIPSLISPITSPRRSNRISDFTHVSPMSLTTSPNSDIDSTEPLITHMQNNSTLQRLHNKLSASTITSPKLVKASSIPSDIAKNYNNHENNSVGQGAFVLHKDSSLNTSTLEKIAIKRKLIELTDSDIKCKRVLRSSKNQDLNTKEHIIGKISLSEPKSGSRNFSPVEISTNEGSSSWHIKESILCCMMQKYGTTTVRPACRQVPDAVLKQISDKIAEYLSKINDGPFNRENTMIEFVEEMKTINYKNFVSGLIIYLTNKERKMELFGKVSCPPAPSMTKSEAVLLYVIRHLRNFWKPVDIVQTILSSIEYTLFRLNKTPDFDVIESVSHFYALLCRYFAMKSRLKAFMFDAMYCILYKSAPLIKQCLEVWPHIIPLAHMGVAKITLVTIFIYLLHFYKCDDRFARVQEIRNILQRRYSYEVTDWNEAKILELVSNSITELRDKSCEKKMLRIAIIMLAKRNGPRWTQNNIVKKLLQFIENEKLPEHVKVFCVWMIGPLMKPYSVDMKVHCEIALNSLLNILNTTTSKRMEEAVLTSMLIMSRHSFKKVNEILLSRKLDNMSPELEDMFRVHIRMKPLHVWLKLLSGPPTSS